MALPMSLNRCLQLLVVGAALVLIAAPPANAQQSTQGTILATRERLRDELARLERAGASGQAGASLIRTRLESGDFQAGDRIVIRVEGEPQLTDTFVVTSGGGPQLELPQVESSVYLKAMDRKRWSFPQVGVAAARVGGETRVALAGVAPIPWLLAGFESATPLARTAWKLDVARALVARAVALL